MPYLEIIEILLVCCNILSNDYLQVLRVLYPFLRNKWFGHLRDF